jgi:hypothetical protein
MSKKLGTVDYIVQATIAFGLFDWTVMKDPQLVLHTVGFVVFCVGMEFGVLAVRYVKSMFSLSFTPRFWRQ